MSLDLLHISDLHFGELHGRRGEPLLDAAVRDWWAANSIFDGFLAHTFAALQDLDELHDRLGRPELIVSGDLTRVGSPSEAGHAAAFLQSNRFQSVPIGLNKPNWIANAIPGNHDHWPGTMPNQPQQVLCMLGGPAMNGPRDLLAQGGAYPRLLPRMPLSPNAELVICALNTDADVGDTSVDRILARGSFRTQCQQALQLFGPATANNDELRGLLIHHSPERHLRRFNALDIEPQSRLALATLVQQARVQFVFTGHAHQALIKQHVGPEWPTSFFELRCGSSTSRDVFPREPLWQLVFHLGRRLPRNVALLHRFGTPSGGQVALTTTLYRRERLDRHRSLPFAEHSKQTITLNLV